jgi:tRNA U38,U39,U40 pseudouridine synthase TruA
MVTLFISVDMNQLQLQPKLILKLQLKRLLHEINNFKIEITVPGRTDIEVGAIINFIYPDARPRDETQKVSEGIDEMYSGYYLVTAIRHKFTLNHHVMILEISKDSLKRKPGTISEQ